MFNPQTKPSILNHLFGLFDIFYSAFVIYKLKPSSETIKSLLLFTSF